SLRKPTKSPYLVQLFLPILSSFLFLPRRRPVDLGMVYIKGSAFANFVRNGFQKHLFAGSSQPVSPGTSYFTSNVATIGAQLKLQLGTTQSHPTSGSQSFFGSQGTGHTAQHGQPFWATSNPLLPACTLDERNKDRESRLSSINQLTFTSTLAGRVPSFAREYSTQTSVTNTLTSPFPTSPEPSLPEDSRAIDSDIDNPTLTENDLLIGKFRKWTREGSLDLVIDEYIVMKAEGRKIPKEVYNNVIHTLCKVRKVRYSEGSLRLAMSVLEDMEANGIQPDGRSYAPLISIYCDRDTGLYSALESLDNSPDTNSVHFERRKSVISYNISKEGINSALRLFNAAIAKGVKLPIYVFNSLLKITSKAGCIDDMITIYSILENSSVEADVRTYQILIMTFGDANDIKSAVLIYEDYKKRVNCLPSHDESWIYNALLYAYFACKDPTGAIKFFKKVYEANPSAVKTVTLTLICQGLSQNGDHEGAYLWLARMITEEKTENPSLIILSRLLQNAVNDGKLEMAHKLFDLTPHIKIINSPGEGFSLYSKACFQQGKIERAKQVIEYTSETTYYHTADVVSDVVLTLAKTKPDIAISTLEKATRAAIRRSGSLTSTRSLYFQLGATLLDALREQSDLTSTRFNRIVESLRWFRKETNVDISLSTARALCYLFEHKDFPSCLFMYRQTVDWLLFDFELLNQSNQLHGLLSNTFEACLFAIMGQGVVIIQLFHNFISQFVASTDNPKLIQAWEKYLHPDDELVNEYRPVRSTSLHQIPEDALKNRIKTLGSLDFRDDVNHRFLFAPDAANLVTSFMEWRAASQRNARIHPVTYFKLMERLAKIGRFDHVREVYELAKIGIPTVTHPDSLPLIWAYVENSLLIAAAYEGDYPRTRTHHQNLINSGFAPNANAFAACILNLKESGLKDEASAALKYLNEALSLGVCPNTYLYNVLMSKLAKARRLADVIDCLEKMRMNGIPPNHITYGVIINVCCRTDNEALASQFFTEMDSIQSYKHRVAPYNTMMQYYSQTKRNRPMVLYYYNRMLAKKCSPTAFSFKLLLEAYTALEPFDFPTAEILMNEMVSVHGIKLESQHYAVILHSKGCVLKDFEGAMAYYDAIVDFKIPMDGIMYQALFEICVANRRFDKVEEFLQRMSTDKVSMTPYIANILIHAWTVQGDINKARNIYDHLAMTKEPSTYEAMARAYVAVGNHDAAKSILDDMATRQFPLAVMSTVSDLLTGAETSKVS
ncbi:Pentatricopeptide repeat-containing protein 5, mitochondrial, partial [Neolecta irregularis DAH-3]